MYMGGITSDWHGMSCEFIAFGAWNVFLSREFFSWPCRSLCIGVVRLERVLESSVFLLALPFTWAILRLSKDKKKKK